MPTGTLTISQYTPNPPIQVDSNSSLEVRGWYTRDYISIDGVTPVLGNSTNGEQGPYYSTTPTLNGSGDIVVPAHVVQITVGANPTANYFEGLWVDGAFTMMLMPNTQGATGWQIPSVYGDPIAYDEIATYNRARRLVYAPNTYFTADETIQEIQRLAGNFDYMAVGVNGIGQASVPPLVASAPIVAMTNDPRVGYMINVKGYPYYAVGDGTTDDTAALLAARTAALITGGTLYFPPGTYKYTSPLTVGSQGVWLVGDSPQVTTLLYTGTGTGVTLGSLTTSSLIYGTGIQGLQILTSNVAGNHLAIAGTSGAVARDLILQGQASALTTSTAILLDDANIGNQFTAIENVQAIHVKIGQRWSGSAPFTVTAVNVKNFSVVSNAIPIAGSKGYLIDSMNGNGSSVGGGNIESMAEGIDTTGNAIVWGNGIRFEGNTHNMIINATGSGQLVSLPINWDAAKFTDNSGNLNPILLPQDGASPSLFGQSSFGAAFFNGNLTLLKVDGGTRYAFLLNDTTTGRIIGQAGSGSSALGGSWITYGNLNGSHPNDVVLGGTNGLVRFNNSGDDSGADKFIVDLSTGQTKIPNTGRLTVAPKTNQTYASTLTIDVTISNHVISAVSGTSATSTFNASSGGSAGDWLYITTEADASGTVTITYGTNFKSGSTQVTTASHFSTIAFCSDGTRFLEMSRTTNLA